jgi:hypothetical protein
MEKAGWWQQRLAEEIDRAVDRNGGKPIPFDQLENIGHDLLDEMDPWHPWPIDH